MTDHAQAKANRLLTAGSLDAIKDELSALTVEEMAALLSTAGGREITGAQIRQDIDGGAPVNEDGTIHFIEYASWLVRERGNGN